MRRVKRKLPRLVADWLLAATAGVCLRVLRLFPHEASINLAGRAARAATLILPRYRTAMKNLKRAFPEKTRAERREILRGSWDNLARTGLEYAYLDQVFKYDPDNLDAGNIEVSGVENFLRLREQSKPAIIFTAHLANWELLSICAAKNGLDVTSLFRTPNNRFFADSLVEARSKLMGPMVASGAGSLFQLTATLERGGRIGLLADQRYKGGVLVPFFGHLADTNPLIAKLARQYECNVYGARAIRLPNQRFRLEITDPLDLPRDADGHIDVAKATAVIQDVVESWIREHPEQWIWFHRRWRLGKKTRFSDPARGTKHRRQPNRTNTA
ncbi:lipid A biosynthesis lauroyl acyltransferase [bacterium BMS3Bbin10]|nr:lipid A biosynthesis lauroyl acyltransferase [bacterium BMS3Bbin10]